MNQGVSSQPAAHTAGWLTGADGGSESVYGSSRPTHRQTTILSSPHEPSCQSNLSQTHRSNQPRFIHRPIDREMMQSWWWRLYSRRCWNRNYTWTEPAAARTQSRAGALTSVILSGITSYLQLKMSQWTGFFKSMVEKSNRDFKSHVVFFLIWVPLVWLLIIKAVVYFESQRSHLKWDDLLHLYSADIYL